MTYLFPTKKLVTAGISAPALALTFVLSASSMPSWAEVDGQHYLYTTQNGDTLIHIAKRYLVDENDWQSLKKINKIADPRFIRTGTSIRIPLADMKTVETQGSVVRVEGPVESNGAKLMPGAPVRVGQDIKTGENGFVTIKLADGSTLVVQSLSQVRLENSRLIAAAGLPQTRIALASGRVEADVAKRVGGNRQFEIRTPTSNMGVRGTKFRVSSDPAAKTSTGEVLEGTVNVAELVASNNRDVAAGFGTVVEQGKPPADPVKLLAPPDLSAAAALHERPLLRFKFTPLEGATGYRAQVATDASFSELRAEGVFKTAEAKFGDLADGNYHLRLRAVDKSGIEGADAVLPFRLKARPEPPFPSAPQNKSKFSGENADFKWAKSTEAATYRFQLARDAKFSALVTDEKAVGADTFTPPNNLTPGEYFWRAASVRPDGDQGPWGDVQSFVLKPKPAAPNPPKEDANSVGFSWSGEPEQKFDFQLSKDASFKELLTEKNLDKPEITIDKPKVPGTYFMRYRSIDPDGFIAPFSSAQSFDVPVPKPPEPNHPWWLLLLLLPVVL